VKRGSEGEFESALSHDCAKGEQIEDEHIAVPETEIRQEDRMTPPFVSTREKARVARPVRKVKIERDFRRPNEVSMSNAPS
jgi:hypothetical protein